ncbi:MAG: hypothetical protein KDE03_18015, partial [Rhodobacteraceae bacterium]|nr:hypothetical protein [Paracoccaceae bacterium]
MIWNVLAIALAASIFAAAPVEAAPVVAAWAAITAGISAITSTVAGAFLFRVAASVVLSALAAAIRGKPDAPERPGIRTEATTTGGVNSETFILGRYATSGNLVAPPYSHENSGDQPNLFLTYVVDVSDLPGVQFSRLIVGGEYIDDLQLNTVTGGEHQYEGNFNTNDFGNYPYLWMTWHDGSQTTADAYMMEYYASYPERPWAADMVGEGIAYAVITFYFAPDVYSGQPGVRFEVEGIPLYDPRKDSTVGGTGSHRWANKATWGFSENPLVMVYNILRGIEMPGGRIWGGKVAAEDLPLANWFAAMNVCDEDVTLKAGGTEKRYCAGYEVKTADDEPASVITELLKACSAEIVEFGGVYKVRVGGPGVPVYYFTDDDIVSDNPQSLVPFPGLESVYNGIHASHPDPKAMWETRDAPPRYNATWEGDDGDRQLIAHVDLPAVSSRPQVQRLMEAWIADERRFRRHSLTLPPDAAVLEPLDSVGWTSARNQYSAEVFEIGELSDDPRSMLQTVAMRARKTGDFDWVPGDEIDVDDPSTIMVKPPVRSVPGWAVSAVSVKNAAGTGKRPAIKLEWDGTKVGDATALEFEVRPYGQTDLVSQGAKTDVAKGQGLVTSGILPGAALEVRGRLVTTRRRAWTAWTYVVTLNIKPGEDDLDETLTTSTVPTGLMVTSELVKDGVAKIIITWIAGANAVSHEIGITRTGGNEVIKKAGGTRYEFETQPGAGFDIRVRAVSGTGSVSAWTATETIVAALDAIPPADPTGLAAQAGYGVMWLSWNANTEADLSHYEVIQKTNSTTPSAGATPKFSAAGTAATISGLANSTHYWYWVRAVDTSGNKSGWSSQSDATTAGT